MLGRFGFLKNDSIDSMIREARGSIPVSIPLFQHARPSTVSGYRKAKFKLMIEPREWPKQIMGMFGCLSFASFMTSF